MEWKLINNAPKTSKGPFGPWLFLGHKERRWIRMGHYYEAVAKWYYSGTNERAEYGEIIGDSPTHWMEIPELPWD